MRQRVNAEYSSRTASLNRVVHVFESLTTRARYSRLQCHKLKFVPFDASSAMFLVQHLFYVFFAVWFGRIQVFRPPARAISLSAPQPRSIFLKCRPTPIPAPIPTDAKAVSSPQSHFPSPSPPSQALAPPKACSPRNAPARLKSTSKCSDSI